MKSIKRCIPKSLICPGRELSIDILMIAIIFSVSWHAEVNGQEQPGRSAPEDLPLTLNKKSDGYRGIWYMNQPSNDEYVYKYSGGLGTYCAKHKPFAIYRPEVNKTFFCFGGATEENSRQLLHMVSFFDHETGTVPRPTVLLDKRTDDAHDNPVISIDDHGFIWIFSTSHGTSRPSYIHRSRRPYEIDEFELVEAVRQSPTGLEPIDNFSYMQAWHIPGDGFKCFFTRYKYPAARTICFMSSSDGATWSEWTRLAAVEQGHYQVSNVGRKGRVGTAFNVHPDGKGLNWRTNLYYIQSDDGGQSWQSADGRSVQVPIKDRKNQALIRDYQAAELNVYLKDLRYDQNERPVILYITSGGYESGPENGPRIWTTAQWTGSEWLIREGMKSDNNYDMGSLSIEGDGTWRIVGPTETGPQPFNPGGEMAMWTSRDRGASWQLEKLMTRQSAKNHTYARLAVNAHPDFTSIWADGHGRQPSDSTLYFCNRNGDVFKLPRKMSTPTMRPEKLDTKPLSP